MARFGRRKDVVQVSENEHAPFEMPGISDAITVREETWAEVLLPAGRFLVLYLLGVAATLIAVYAILAGTLLFATHVDGVRLYVTRTTYPGGVPTLNSEALVSSRSDEGTLVSNLVAGFTQLPDESVYRVHSGPFDTARFTGADVYVNDKLVGRQATSLATTRTVNLSSEYVMECISGACKRETDRFAIVKAANIYGEVRHGW